MPYCRIDSPSLRFAGPLALRLRRREDTKISPRVIAVRRNDVAIPDMQGVSISRGF